MNKPKPLESLACIGWRLVGPFEVLSEKIKVDNVNSRVKFHLHWRFYYDPPESLTVIVSDDVGKDTSHIGYFRDDPNDIKCVVVANSGTDCKLNILGDNLFAAVSQRVKEKLALAKGKAKNNLKDLSKLITEYAEANKLSLEKQSSVVKARNTTVVADTFHGAGIVVPIDENDVGYRPLHETDAKLKKMFQKIHDAPNDDIRMTAFSQIQEMITYIQFANDECDYGMGLELGVDMFCHGSRYLNKASCRLLTVAYQLLKRELYAKIFESHIVDRRNENFARLPDS